MSRAPSLLILASLSLLALSTTSAMAVSGSEADCTAAGGTYTKDGPNSVCVFPEEKVSSPNANPDNNASTTQDTSTGHGNLDNKTTTSCTGVPGQCK